MADLLERSTKVRDVSLIFADDANVLANLLRKYVRGGNWDGAEEVAAKLQRIARDIKWLMQRQPRD